MENMYLLNIKLILGKPPEENNPLPVSVFDEMKGLLDQVSFVGEELVIMSNSRIFFYTILEHI